MAISSSVWKPVGAHARSPTLPLRSLPLSFHEARKPFRTWDSDDKHKKRQDEVIDSPSKTRHTSRLFSQHRRRFLLLAQNLALPRKWRRPTGPLMMVLAFICLFVLAYGINYLANALAVLAKLLVFASMLIRSVSQKSTSLSATSTNHVYHPNGYLLVNPRGTHPILTLIEKAERDWNQKVERQSKTLQQAANEYRRRYKRHPPRGFDAWRVRYPYYDCTTHIKGRWAYVEENDVQMPDEYDQIDRDLRAYWALEADDVVKRNQQMQEREGTFTLAVAGGGVTVHGTHAHLRRATDVADIVARFSQHIRGDTNMTFIIEDQPAVMISDERRARMHELAGLGERIGPSDFMDEITESDRLSNYALACPHRSPLRKYEQGDFHQDLSSLGHRSFVWDHVQSMDICNHPEWRPLHGLASSKGTGLGPLVPLFTFAKTSAHDDILATPLEQYWDHYEGEDPAWAQKKHDKLLWRGTTTGAEFRTGYPWQQSQRSRLHFMSHEQEGAREVLESIDDGERFRLVNQSVADLNRLYMDTSFAGQPAQCDFETCEWMLKNINFAPTQGLDESYQYKYMMDVDGNGWSGRFHRLMSTKSLVLKSTIFPEWYADRLQPWYHYVPIKVDYSDLYDVMSFFVGSVDGHGGHDAIAERIAENGRQWAGTHWRRVDMASYMFRLVLEYDRLLHQEDADIDFLG